VCPTPSPEWPRAGLTPAASLVGEQGPLAVRVSRHLHRVVPRISASNSTRSVSWTSCALTSSPAASATTLSGGVAGNSGLLEGRRAYSSWLADPPRQRVKLYAAPSVITAMPAMCFLLNAIVRDITKGGIIKHNSQLQALQRPQASGNTVDRRRYSWLFGRQRPVIRASPTRFQVGRAGVVSREASGWSPVTQVGGVAEGRESGLEFRPGSTEATWSVWSRPAWQIDRYCAWVG